MATMLLGGCSDDDGPTPLDLAMTDTTTTTTSATPTEPGSATDSGGNDTYTPTGTDTGVPTGTDTVPAGTDTAPPSSDSQHSTDTPTDSGTTFTVTGPVMETTGTYVLSWTDGTHTWRIACTTQDGGRIVEFSLDGHNVIATASQAPMFGSTFWTSPQSAWNWPPPTNMDDTPYAAAIDGDTIVLTGNTIDALGVRIVKRIGVENGAAVITYRIENTTSSPVAMAPWEITRVLPGGITYFAPGGGTITSALPTQQNSGLVWFVHDPNMAGDGKLFSDGRGWIAHADGTVVFVKTFPDIAASEAAQSEAEIEIYAKNSYVEVENQGPFATIAAQGASTWTVRWTLMPQTGALAVGDPALVAAAPQ